jgi:DNA polymerase-3 subunit alpha
MIYQDFKDECSKRLEKKGLDSKKYKERLVFELDVMHAQAEDYKTNVFSYFMDLSAKHSKSDKLKNSNNMLVSYLLDITDEDPIKDELELIKTKGAEYPDIDTDFEDAQRDYVKEYLIQRYGQEHVASICAMHQMHPKTVIKDVSRIKNIPFEEVNEITKLIKDKMTVNGVEVPTTIELLYENVELINQFFNKYSYVNLYDLCAKLDGNVRHLGTHAAGLVITPKDKPLNTIVGLEKTKDVYVTCWQEGDDRELSKIGLIKFDILGLNTLTVIKEALKLIKENHNVDVDIDEVALDDKRVLQGFHDANTIGIFQFERDWIRSLLRKIKITTFEDISAVNALNRPGPLDAKMDQKFWKIKNGFEKPSYLHPLLEPILKNTYCIILYQEQIMEISQKLAGFASDEADAFRSVLSKGKADMSKGINPFAKHEKKFIDGCLKNGVKGKIKVERVIRFEAEMPVTATNVRILQDTTDAIGPYKKIACEVEIADELFSQIKTFAGYGFNKSHSVEYGFLAYQCMYLKTYYPKEFMASLLTHTPNKVDLKTNENKFADYLYEARRMGVKVLAPNINKSIKETRVVGEELQVGFSFIKGLGDKAYEEIARKRPFKDFKDFMMKVDGRFVNKSAIFALIHSGSFDEFLAIGDNRKNLIKRFELIREYCTFRKDKKTNVPTSPTAIMAINEESEVLGGELFNTLLHLVDKAEANKGYAADDQIVKFDSINKINSGTKIRIVGVVDSFTIKPTASGSSVGFLVIKNGSKSKKLMVWNSDIQRLQTRPDMNGILIKNNVIAVQVERQKDYKDGKTFVLSLDGIKKLL